MKKLLMANRGEIAIRIFTTARQMGIGTVAVYSEADANALHRFAADEAVPIGPGEAAQSYLRMDKLLDAARATGADAIHPGYGFLSEREEFAEKVIEAGLTFVGPPPEAMRKLGAKIAAKQIAVSVDVPVTPGFFEEGATVEQLRESADKIGYPIMLKASAGGGGRGMRIVHDPANFDKELQMASDEALNAFGDGAMMVEKYVTNPRHVEVQIVADREGNVLPLYERECSLQRRHQKLVEESPSPYLLKHPEMWDAMREAARRLVKASGYVGAGTVEFMVDPKENKFYFLEVNARLQVEHPVTEAITGLDLVKLQLEVARGKLVTELAPDFVAGDRARINGHAIEARIVAEDPAQNFLPSVGQIVGWAEPKMPGIRVASGFGNGREISRFYDSLIAKVIAHGPDRETARLRLLSALRDFHILGVKTNLAYLIDVVQHQGFIDGEFDTGFLGREFGEWAPPAPDLETIAFMVHESAPSPAISRDRTRAASAWVKSDNWRVHRPIAGKVNEG